MSKYSEDFEDAEWRKVGATNATEPVTVPMPAAMGWECPRCHAIYAPHVHQCICAPPAITTTTLTIEVKP